MSAARIADPRYSNWIRDTLALLYLKEGLEVFVDQQSATFHSKLKDVVGEHMCACGWQALVRDKHGWKVKHCPSGTCQTWLTNIIDHHHKKPLPNLTTKNTDPMLWPTKNWEVMKVYQPKGCEDQHSAKEADSAGILTLLKNCDHFHPYISSLADIDDLLDIRNRMMHSCDFYVDAADINNDLHNMLKFLHGLKKSLPSSEGQPVQKAIDNIEELRSKKLDLSLNRELELKAIRAKQLALESDMRNLGQTIKEVGNETATVSTGVSTVKAELNTNIQALQQRLDSQLSQIKTVEKKMATDQQLTTDVQDNLAYLQQQFDILEKDLRTTKRDMASMEQSHESRLADHETQLQSHQQKLVTIEEQMEHSKSHESRLADHDTQLQSHQQKLATIEEQMEQSKTASESRGAAVADIKGISTATYKEAVKNRADIRYVCLPCVRRIPHLEPLILERSDFLVDRDDEAEMEAPRQELSVAAIDDEPPVLDEEPMEIVAPAIADVPPAPTLAAEAEDPVEIVADEPHAADADADADDSVAAIEELIHQLEQDVSELTDHDVDDIMDVSVDMEEEVQDLDRGALPRADSTHVEGGLPQADLDDESVSFNISARNESVHPIQEADQADQSISFNISARNETVHPIQEQSIQDVLSETVIEDRDVTYTIVNGVSQRQTKLLLTSNGYSFGVKRENKGSVAWRCTSRSRQAYCYATIKQIGNRFVPGPVNHVHPALPSNQLKKEVYAKVRKTAKENIFRPARGIAEDAILEKVQPEDVSIPKKGLLKRVCNRARAKHRPSEPKTLDFEVDHDFLQLEDFAVADLTLGEFRHFVFASPYQLRLLRQARRWYIDGTFKIIGAPFKKPGQRRGQLFSIHAFIEKDGETQQFPLVFCLMSRQTKEDYVAIFRAVNERMGQPHVEGFVVDFEKAAWLAIREVYPGVELKGCVFHWTQAVWRHVQECGLAETYQRRAAMHGFIRQLLALPFLPSDHIAPAFQKLRRQATTPETERLVTYLDNQWLHNGVFPTSSWSVYKQTVRTNNDVEGWHHRINKTAAESGLQFYKLVPLLKREADLVDVSVRGGDLQRNVRGRSKFVERQITKIWDDYSADRVTSSRLLKRCGELYGVRI